MVKSSQQKGTFTDKQMWKSVESVSELLEDIKKQHPDMYWAFMREQAGIINGCHYDESFALHDVSTISYTDRNGKKCDGGYWSLEQIEAATKAMSFPASTTKWDKYVAFNSFYSDTCTVYTDEEIIKGAFKFYFADEDAPAGKIWRYMQGMRE